MSPFSLLAVFLGGGLGALARHLLNLGMIARFGDAFPYATMLVNISGSFVIGIFFVVLGPEGRLDVSNDVRLFVLIGLLGGYTTFSSFSLQTIELAQAGQWIPATLYVFLTVILCLIGVWLGVLLGQMANFVR